MESNAFCLKLSLIEASWHTTCWWKWSRKPSFHGTATCSSPMKNRKSTQLRDTNSSVSTPYATGTYVCWMFDRCISREVFLKKATTWSPKNSTIFPPGVQEYDKVNTWVAANPFFRPSFVSGRGLSTVKMSHMSWILQRWCQWRPNTGRSFVWDCQDTNKGGLTTICHRCRHVLANKKKDLRSWVCCHWISTRCLATKEHGSHVLIVFLLRPIRICRSLTIVLYL